MQTLPQTRTAEIIIQEIGKELMLYDLRINKAYNLNETLKTVYKTCDGVTSFDELKRRAKLSDEIIYLALDELKKNNLLTGDYESPFAGMTRREVIRKVGLASMIVLPIITGLVAPSAAQSASTTVRNEVPCVPLNQCRASRTVLCPTGCTGTYNFDVYLTFGGICGGDATPITLDCTTNQNAPSFYDFRRVS